jgi:hypothetical protein
MKAKRTRATTPAFRITASHTIFLPVPRMRVSVAYFRVAAAVKSAVAIENLGDAINQIVQTTHEARHGPPSRGRAR